MMDHGLSVCQTFEVESFAGPAHVMLTDAHYDYYHYYYYWPYSTNSHKIN